VRQRLVKHDDCVYQLVTYIGEVSVCVCVLSQATSVETESTASPPHALITTAASQPAPDSSDTDQHTVMSHDAADRGDIADQSQLCTDSSHVTSATAAVGSDTVSSAGGDISSTNKTDIETVEPHAEGKETVSTAAVEGIPKTAGSETVDQSDDKAGSETASASSAAEMDRTTEAVDECKADTEAGEMQVTDETADKSKMMGSGTSSDGVVQSTGNDDVVQSTNDDVVQLTNSDDVVQSTSKDAVKSSANVDYDGVSDFLALSYLAHPPDGATFDQPYVDSFWQCRWMRMEAEIRRVLRKSSRLASDVITLDSSSSGDYDSSDCELSDEYEDSLASNSPIFIHEKTAPAVDNEDRESADEIVLDENSSNAIVVGDDDEDDEDEDAEEDDDVDEIVCSGETNQDNKNGDSSIVVCDADNSVVESSPPCSSSQPSVARPHDIESTNSMAEVDSPSSMVATQPDVADKCVEVGKVANGSGDVEGVVDKTDAAAGCSSELAGGDAGDDVVSNGTCCVAETVTDA